jgi:hypothetical protein
MGTEVSMFGFKSVTKESRVALKRAVVRSFFPIGAFSLHPIMATFLTIYVTEEYNKPTHFITEDGGRIFPRNIGTHLQDYTVSIQHIKI